MLKGSNGEKETKDRNIYTASKKFLSIKSSFFPYLAYLEAKKNLCFNIIV